MISNLSPLSRAGLPASIRFVGHAIVSVDGMIADAAGGMPPELRNAADWRRFQAALDASALVVLGRLGHERHPNPGRRRLVFTSTIAGIAADPRDPQAILFNPAGAGLAEVLARLDIADGIVAVTGGTRVFEAFLPVLDGFDLAEVQMLALPGGRPCFGSAHPRTALTDAGLSPQLFELIDPAAGVSLTHWTAPRTFA
jgi:hypothetical protein